MTQLRPAMLLAEDRHTNSADAGMPTTALTEHITDLEERLDRIYLVTEEVAERRRQHLSMEARAGVELINRIRRDASFRVR